MDTQHTNGTLLSASNNLKLAVKQEKQKPHYKAQRDPCIALWIASSVRRKNPEAFDLGNPTDLMIWAFVAD